MHYLISWPDPLIVSIRRKIVFTFFACAIIITGYAQPVISSFLPVSGPINTSVTISGNNFSVTAANNIVFFGAVRANVSAATATSLTVNVPAGATYQPLTVTVNGLTAYSLKPFIVTFPGGAPMTPNPDQSQNSFESEVDSTTDLHPNGVAIADFDGDGKPDLATPNNYSMTGVPASISILRNTNSNGSISFALRQDISSGVLTYAIASGDIDGDGKPDLISTSIQDRTVSVFKNTSITGSITFAPKIDFPTGDNPYCIAVRDMDGDGKTDMIVANYLSNSVSVYRNTSSGGVISFATRVDLTTDLGPHFVVVGDLDGDGKPDIATANELSDNVSVFRNTSTAGSISFASRIAFTTGGEPYGIAIGDIDGDGKADLATANNGSNNFSVLRNTGSSGSISFAAKTDFPVGALPYSISIGDLNGDGKPDVVVPSANMTVSQNTSTPGAIAFANKIFLYPLVTSYIVSIGDITGDGKDDLAGAGFSVEYVSLFRNKNNEPTVRSFTPTTAGTGTTVTITGVNFTGTSSVSFGGVAAQSFTVVNPTTITAVVGTGVSGNISVTNAYGTGSKAGFIYAGPPIINSFNPLSAPQGATVNIRGYNFTGATSVSFGGVAAQSFSVVSPTSISAIVGAGASGNVSVGSPYGTATLGGFIILPGITSFSPASAATGATVTITGTNLTGTTAVNFGGTPAASFTVVSATTITAVVANGSSGAISITNANGTATIPGFIYIPPPTISSFAPSPAGTGTTVTITGTNFTGATSVKFGGTNASSFNVVSATTITAIVGAGTTGVVSVTTPGGTVTLPGFTYIPPPTITSFTPSSTGTGGTVSITGTNFTTATNVNFGGTAATSFIINSPTSITATVAGGASGNVSVVTIGGTANLNGFVYTTLPIINTVSPVSGPVGTTVTITGANFDPITANNVVYFGPVKATVSSGNSNSLVVTVPVGATYGAIAVTTNYLTTTSDLPFTVTFPGGDVFNASTFAGRTDFQAGSNPSDVATADLDGDGKPDLIASNYWSNTISILRNTGTVGILSFAPKADFEAGHNPHNIAIGDIDGDGKKDVIFLNSHPAGGTGQDTLSILKNISTAGSIAFAQRFTLWTGFIPADVAIADFNGDRKPDLAVTNSGNENVWIFRNTSVAGTISFANPSIINLMNGTNPHYVSSIAAGDLNGDGKPDLVVGKQASTYVTLMRNTSSASSISFSVSFFGSFIGSGAFNNVSVTDFDMDGKPDVLTDNFMFRNVTTPGSSINFTWNSNSLGGVGCSDDLNGDGKPDFTRINTSPSTVGVSRNAGTPGTFSMDDMITYPTGTNPWGITTGDYDLDGKPDIATANYGFNTISILKNLIGYTGPLVTSFTPVSGPEGTIVTITGSNLLGTTAVSFGGIAASSFTIVSATTITAVVGNGASGNVSVTTPNGTIALAWFSFIPPPPTITSATPLSAATGNIVTITGTNFSEVSAVKFGGTSAASFTVNSSTSITAVVANGATGDITVTTLGGMASLSGFTFISAPTITSFAPTSAGAGTSIVITGTNFTGATNVKFGNVDASSFIVNSATSITAVVGSGATGSVSVITPGGTVSLAGFTFIAAPLITSFTPASGNTGTSVTITGTNFTGATAVIFGGIAASSFIVNSSTSITAVVASGASGNVSVTTPGGTASLAGFTYNAVTAIGGPNNNDSRDLVVYPNPSLDDILIKHPPSSKKAFIRFMDILGREVKLVIPARNSKETQTNIAGLAPGIYMIIWTDGRVILSRTFMVK